MQRSGILGELPLTFARHRPRRLSSRPGKEHVRRPAFAALANVEKRERSGKAHICSPGTGGTFRFANGPRRNIALSEGRGFSRAEFPFPRSVILSRATEPERSRGRRRAREESML